MLKAAQCFSTDYCIDRQFYCIVIQLYDTDYCNISPFPLLKKLQIFPTN